MEITPRRALPGSRTGPLFNCKVNNTSYDCYIRRAGAYSTIPTHIRRRNGEQSGWYHWELYSTMLSLHAASESECIHARIEHEIISMKSLGCACSRRFSCLHLSHSRKFPALCGGGYVRVYIKCVVSTASISARPKVCARVHDGRAADGITLRCCSCVCAAPHTNMICFFSDRLGIILSVSADLPVKGLKKLAKLTGCLVTRFALDKIIELLYSCALGSCRFFL